VNILIKNIKSLLQAEQEKRKWVAGREMSHLPLLENSWLYISDGKIVEYGAMEQKEAFEKYLSGDHIHIIDASDRIVMPAFCDPHTHLVYAGSREIEYTDKIKGLSYEEIAKRGGGILNSSSLLHETPEDVLFEQSIKRVREIIRMGTGAVEIKSGYGLNLEDELKMLRVIKRIKEADVLTVKATFLGAHAIPEQYKNKPDQYVDLVVNEMIPAVSSEQLADYIDVFCDRGFFTPQQTARILEAGKRQGMQAKLHANELGFTGGIQTGVAFDALSVDHLEFTGEEEIRALSGTATMPTILPGASFFLGLSNAPARDMIENGLPVALASDYNPGSSPSGNMKLIMSLACINLKMLPEEVINAVTLNSAYAMGLEESHGSIFPGKTASLIITNKIPSYAFLPYAYGSDLIDTVIINGKIQELS